MKTKNVNTEKAIFNVDIFVIPNGIYNINSDWNKNSPSNKWIEDKCSKVLGMKSESGRYVQVWTVGHDCDNWSCSCESCPANLQDEEGFRYPELMPIELFKDLKEGETKVVETDTLIINMTAKQLSYRYRRFGRFEEVMRCL